MVACETPDRPAVHLLINNQAANTASRAGNHWICAPMRGQEATLERLRVDRQFEEAVLKGPDPLHLAEVFGLDEKTAMRYTTTSALVNELAEADAARRLSPVIARYSKVDLLCLDEFGYLNLDKKGARLLFQIFTEREECKATAVATNSPFAERDKIFADPRLCAAIADRITFRCTLIQTGTESYRFQSTEADRQATAR
ncbi:ATP-binding protein [Streptomyces sp. NPDC057582]|uniref:ATP-binding protein n=1 Tax=Streptomyces sp. NPDC057582 TaxID=3346174 RepID=UPI0036CA163F